MAPPNGRLIGVTDVFGSGQAGSLAEHVARERRFVRPAQGETDNAVGLGVVGRRRPLPLELEGGHVGSGAHAQAAARLQLLAVPVREALRPRWNRGPNLHRRRRGFQRCRVEPLIEVSLGYIPRVPPRRSHAASQGFATPHFGLQVRESLRAACSEPRPSSRARRCCQLRRRAAGQGTAATPRRRPLAPSGRRPAIGSLLPSRGSTGRQGSTYRGYCGRSIRARLAGDGADMQLLPGTQRSIPPHAAYIAAE
ncbi:hypothetical protein PSPO01_05572 [Paraphaeosphaeria sporulosa]